MHHQADHGHYIQCVMCKHRLEGGGVVGVEVTEIKGRDQTPGDITGAEDIVTNDDQTIDVQTTPEAFLDVKDAMLAAGLEPEMAEVTMSPSTSVDLVLEDAEKVMRLVDTLEDLDDVQNVYTNADFSDEVMAQLA